MTASSQTAALPGVVAVSGAGGLIGKALVERLRGQGCEVRPIVRRLREGVADKQVRWDQQAGTLDADALEGVDAVVHLAGESIVGRWTTSKKKRIEDSRIAGTDLLARTLAGLGRKPSVLVSASAVGYYGDRGDTELDERAAPGDAGGGFLRSVCERWEAAADPAREAGIRVVHPRIGMVLEKGGGALATMLPAFRMGFGGVLGDGKQWVPWVHGDDLVASLLFALTETTLEGPVNAVAPKPVTNREMTKALGKVLGRPTVLPVPGFGARLAFGALADELLLASQRVVPAKLLAAGFSFQFEELETALRDLLGRPEAGAT